MNSRALTLNRRRTSRDLRDEIRKMLLAPGDPADFLEKIGGGVSLKKAINPLISHFYHESPEIRHRAISCFGRVVAALAGQDMESARVVMRRLIWSLNDESGGIGWGAPEAMAEVMIRHEGLAREYVRILLSYVWEEGNFLEHDPLRREALMGLRRLAEKRPGLVKSSHGVEILKLRLNDSDPECRDFARRTLSILENG